MTATGDFVPASGSAPFRVFADAVVTPFPRAKVVVAQERPQSGQFRAGPYDLDDHMEC